MGQAPDEIREQIEETRSRMGDTVEAIGYKTDVKSRAKESVANMKGRVVGSVANAKDSIVGKASDARDSVVQGVGSATPDSQQVKQKAQRAASVAQQNPLGLAFGAVALGFLAGLMVPSTSIEDEKIGAIADDLKEKAKETGQEALERGKQVAQEVTQQAASTAQDAVQQVAATAKETAQEHAEQLASSAQENAQDVASSVQGSQGQSSAPPPAPVQESQGLGLG